MQFELSCVALIFPLFVPVFVSLQGCNLGVVSFNFKPVNNNSVGTRSKTYFKGNTHS